MRRVADWLSVIGLFAGLAIAAAWLADLGGQSVSGPYRVKDGDSFETADGRRFRLRGIDAPEYRQTCERDGDAWPCGRDAARRLRALMTREATCTGSELDRFDRLLVICRAGDTEINREMVQSGFAVSFGGYYAEEGQARRQGAGIWAGSFERPQHWRDRERAIGGDMAGESDHGIVTAVMRRLRLWLHLAGQWLSAKEGAA
ncbi:MAG: thermonuclease family protein [Nitratireductor sp.]|nr:thermonuclease family protein [Nitratireductor sp.]